MYTSYFDFKSVNKYGDDWGSHFEIAFPGLKKEDLSVKLVRDKDGKKLIVENKKEKEDRNYEIESIYVPQKFTISISDDFDTDKMKVKLESGILYIAVPFAEEKAPKETEITIE